MQSPRVKAAARRGNKLEQGPSTDTVPKLDLAKAVIDMTNKVQILAQTAQADHQHMHQWMEQQAARQTDKDKEEAARREEERQTQQQQTALLVALHKLISKKL